MSELTLLIKPTSYQCNIQCDYCFYKRAAEIYTTPPSSFMNLKTAEVLIRKALSQECLQNNFCWQGGEPTLMGIDFFRQIVEFQKKYALPGQIIGNSLQTNGLLIDESWADFLASHYFLVGLSLDGPREIHDRYRKRSSGAGTFDKVMQTAKLLQRSGVTFNLLTLLTDGNVSQPERLYRFFRDHGFSHLQFIPCVERDPVMTSARAPFSISGEELGAFECKLFDLWLHDGFMNVSIRSFEDILIRYIDGVHVSCNWQQECASYLVVEYNGDVYPCDFFVYSEWLLGNIVHSSFDELFDCRLKRMFKGLKAILPSECACCRWLIFCNGDCIRFRPNGPRGLSVLCSARKRLFNHMEPHLESIKKKALLVRRSKGAGAQPVRVGRNEPCPCCSGEKYKKCCGR